MSVSYAEDSRSDRVRGSARNPSALPWRNWIVTSECSGSKQRMQPPWDSAEGWWETTGKYSSAVCCGIKQWGDKPWWVPLGTPSSAQRNHGGEISRTMLRLRLQASRSGSSCRLASSLRAGFMLGVYSDPSTVLLPAKKKAFKLQTNNFKEMQYKYFQPRVLGYYRLGFTSLKHDGKTNQRVGEDICDIKPECKSVWVRKV